MSRSAIFVFLLVVYRASAQLQACTAAGERCKTKDGADTCSSCPADTTCNQFTTSSGNLGHFYCQFTQCLLENADCANRVGTCCDGLACGANPSGAGRTCQKACTAAGDQCQTTTGTTTCINCPTDTACTQFTTASGNLGAFYCQFTQCLVENADCANRVGTCCDGLTCGPNPNGAGRTCNGPTTTTTTTTATGCQTVSGAQCQFPFTFKGKTYTGCTNAGGFRTPWCSTLTNNGVHVQGNYGDCDLSTCSLDPSCGGKGGSGGYGGGHHGRPGGFFG